MRLKSTYLVVALLATFSCKPQKQSEPGIFVKEGFIVEKLYTPGDHDQGSWVAITKDDKGRLIASDQYGSLYFIDVPDLDSYDSVEVTPIPMEIGGAQGLLWAYGGLYVMVNKEPSEESGLYRLTDTNGDGLLDSKTLLQQFVGNGEHGPHAVVLGPDGFIYVIAGNHTDLPETFESRQKPVWQEDQLFPSIKDPRGHANNRNAPGGWIARVDKDGKDLTVITNGFRNAYDMAFNEDGELFTFDSDMEWDLGTPWYRPIRVCHVTPGAEFGWRTGSAKWPAYYPDNLPSVVDVGQGSPTGIVTAKDLNFPGQYKKGLFVFDWSFGTMYHISLTPDGASYVGAKEEFLSGSGLPLTDGVAGDDGALYFLTGGRRLQSHLFRVFYNGSAPDQDSKVAAKSADRELRIKIESFQKEGEADFDLIWNSLGNKDRRIRYAARTALEYRDSEVVNDKLTTETDADIILNSSLAIARTGNEVGQRTAFDQILNLDFAALAENQKLDLIRAYSLLFIRGDFGQGDKNSVKAQLSDYYPSDSKLVNWELVQILAYLNDPSVVARTMDLMQSEELDFIASDLIEAEVGQRSAELQGRYGDVIEWMKTNSPRTALMHYVKAISYVDVGWIPEMREDYFRYFAKLLAGNGGASYNGFAIKIRDNALKNAPDQLKAKLKNLSGEELIYVNDSDLANLPQPQGPGNNWEVDQLLALVESTDEVRDLENGAKMFQASLCAACHSFQGSGSNLGPDLTQITTRFTTKDLLEALVTPNKTISDQYAATEIRLKDDRILWGRVFSENADTVFLNQNPMRASQVTKIAREEIAEQKTSDRSIMFPALLNRLNEEEVKDLIYYIQSGGGKPATNP